MELMLIVVDLMLAINWLANHDTLALNIFVLVYDCKNMMEHDWAVFSRHIYREANRCVANKAVFVKLIGVLLTRQCSNLEEYDQCPSFVVHFILYGIYKTNWDLMDFPMNYWILLCTLYK